MAAMIDLEDGVRMIAQLTDVEPEEASVGMEVEMSFRTLGESGGIHNYYWRCMPPRDSWTGKETA